ncbi:hypothetical protein CONLIGDRAFT_645327 [Coniochaeta ligniaria NRRL 30616]|uniref:Uncharacterized protein n=1 Tax=Coniochaeta ligniaria NRRL 30616 TaxID=1408157 RepID=A0A1J7JHH9_9PEZI|nr:hypothetical protein CONLIGDRAFT_645327 [Coniochaeta ligniaria NRRL 30616]
MAKAVELRLKMLVQPLTQLGRQPCTGGDGSQTTANTPGRYTGDHRKAAFAPLRLTEEDMCIMCLLRKASSVLLQKEIVNDAIVSTLNASFHNFDGRVRQKLKSESARDQGTSTGGAKREPHRNIAAAWAGPGPRHAADTVTSGMQTFVLDVELRRPGRPIEQLCLISMTSELQFLWCQF